MLMWKIVERSEASVYIYIYIYIDNTNGHIINFLKISNVKHKSLMPLYIFYKSH